MDGFRSDRTSPLVADTTSTPVASSGHNYLGDLSEIVNPADGSLSIRIAAPPQKERGAGMPHYVFVYDSYVGSPVPGGNPIAGIATLVKPQDLPRHFRVSMSGQNQLLLYS